MTAKASYSYARGHRILEIAAIALFFLAQWVLGARAVEGVTTAIEGVGVAASALSGYLAADFLSGVAHWAGDTVGDENTPVLGKHFVRPFRQHHVDPKAITRHDFVETNGNNSIVSVPVLAALVIVMPREPGVLFYACLTLAFGALFVFCTNQFHKWAHADRVLAPVRWLQRAGLVLSPEHHAIHHAAPHDKYYCITVGWLNPLLTRLRFFRTCERVLARFRPGWLHLEERQRSAAS